MNRGFWNFDEIRIDFYRDANAQFEAFKRGLYDFRNESEPLRWHDGYDFPAARNGEVIRDTSSPACRNRRNTWCSTPGGRCSPI